MKRKLFNRMHLQVALLLMLSLGVGAQVPEFVWVEQIGGNNDESGIGIKADPFHNVYSIVLLRDTTTFSFGSATFIANGGNACLIKQDSSGKLIWARMLPYNTLASGLAIDPTGKEVYITGQYSGTIDFDPGAGTEIHTSALSSRGRPGIDFYISKFDSAGNFKWVRVAGAAGGESGRSLVVDQSSEHVYVTGTFSDTVDFGFGQSTAQLISTGSSGTFILKMTSGGSLVWAKAYTGNSVSARGITVDKIGDVYLTGEFKDTVDFDPDPNNTASRISVPGHLDIFVSKLTSSGAYVWAKSMGGAAYDNGASVAVDDSFNVYVTGGFQVSGNFDPDGTHYLYSNGAQDAFILKLKADGSLAWAGNVGSYVDDYGMEIRLDKFGNVYTCGNFQSPRSDFDPGTGAGDTFNLVSYGGYDGYVLKLSNDGKFKWARNVGHRPALDRMDAFDVVDGYIYCTGVFYKTADFDPAGPGLHQLTSTDNSSDVYLLKWFECLRLAELDFAINGPDSVCFDQTYTYSVDPVEGALSYEWEIPANWKGSSDSSSITITTDEELQGFVRVKMKGICDSTVKELTVTLAMLPAQITIDEFQLSTTNSSYYKSWQWYLNGNKIEGATNPTLDVTENGMYSVVVTGGAGCTDSAWYEVTNVTSVENIGNNRYVSIYPNPVSDFAEVHNMAGMPVQVAVMSVEGRELSKEKISGTAARIDMSGYSSGVYILQVRGNKDQLLQVEKIIKK